MEIVLRNVHELINYEKNARTHTESQILEISESIKKFGFNDPIEIGSDNVVISGHGRLEAAILAGLTQVPTVTHSHLNKTLRKGYMLAANRIAMSAGWEYGKLKDELTELKEDGFDLSLTGFSSDEIEDILNPEVLNEGLVDEDDCGGISEETICKRGDVWVLGNSRLMCGDSTMIDDVEKLMDGKNPALMVTDPPYGVSYDPEWRDEADLGVGESSRGKVENDDRVDWTDTYSLFPGTVAYVWHAGIYSPEIANHLQNCDFEIVSQIIWVKQHFALSRGDYHWQHEPCWYVVKRGHKHNWQGARDQATTWEIKNNSCFGNSEKEETWGHGTQKPVECMARPIQNNSKPNDYIYDPFGGSGTTLIACEKLGRRCLMMELSEKYCDVIIRRWEKFTGNKAVICG